MTDNDRPADVPNYLELGLSGQGVVVLGGGTGIGRQTVHALTQAGARVVCVDRDQDLIAEVVTETGCHGIRADVTSRDELAAALSEAQQNVGSVTRVVDIIGAADIGPISAVDDAVWQAQLDVNLRHAFLTVQLAAPIISAAGGGSIAFVGSISGVRAVPEQSLYGVFKAALHHLVITAGDELGPAGIRVNAVAPGWTKTPRLLTRLGAEHWATVDRSMPRGSAGTPDEIAGPLLFLLSNLSSYMTGQVLVVDGGFTNKVPRLDVFS